MRGRWEAAPDDLRKLYYLQPYKDGWIKIRHSKDGCKSLSFNIPSHKTFCIDTKSESAILVWDNKIYVNDDGNLFIYEVPHATESMKNLSPSKIIDGVDWAYFIFPTKEGVVWGGSGEYLDGCAPIKSFSEELTIIKHKDCKSDNITEYYSAIKIDDSYLIGTYPSGNLLDFNGNTSLLKKYEIHPNIARRYFESQSLAQSTGILFVGLYPYGEVIYFDTKSSIHKSKNISRLFSGPPKNEEYSTPYYGEFLAEINERSGSNALKVEYYQEGIHPNLLGQRIPTSSVLDGKICFSTGNFTFLEPSKKVTSKIDNLNEYGKVHCMSIPNQTLFPARSKNNYKVNIHKNGFRVYSSGNLIRTIKFKDIAL